MVRVVRQITANYADRAIGTARWSVSKSWTHTKRIDRTLAGTAQRPRGLAQHRENRQADQNRLRESLHTVGKLGEYHSRIVMDLTQFEPPKIILGDWGFHRKPDIDRR